MYIIKMNTVHIINENNEISSAIQVENEVENLQERNQNEIDINENDIDTNDIDTMECIFNILTIVEDNLNFMKEQDYNDICLELKKINIFVKNLEEKNKNLELENINMNNDLHRFIVIINNFNKLNLKLIKKINRDRNI